MLLMVVLRIHAARPLQLQPRTIVQLRGIEWLMEQQLLQLA